MTIYFIFFAIISVILMINLYRQESKTKNKTMYPVNKSHIASMNLRVSAEAYCQPSRQPLKNATNRQHQDQQKSRSGHKYKKSIVLPQSTIQLVKKSSQNYPKNKDLGMSTERFSKEKPHKRSIDYGITRVKTEFEEVKQKLDQNMVQINVQELREMVHKLKSLRGEKQNLKRQLQMYKKQMKKNTPNNSVLKALA